MIAGTPPTAIWPTVPMSAMAHMMIMIFMVSLPVSEAILEAIA